MDLQLDRNISRRERKYSEVSKHSSRQISDLEAAPSGYGYEPVHTSFCPDGVPLEFALLSLLAAFGVAFGVLYVALTMITGRRRRSVGRAGYEANFLLLESNMADMIWSGRRQNREQLEHVLMTMV